jgi:uracil-DNA glycosylase
VSNVLQNHVEALYQCRRCPQMQSSPVTGYPVKSRVLLVGQAPGIKEPILQRPFAWTAGKTLFKWFLESTGVDEEHFRASVYMAAVCRCFPGKNSQGGDRVPSKAEIANCQNWLQKEFELLNPGLVIPVGKLAIAQFMPSVPPLTELIGKKLRLQQWGIEFDLIPLPHPSGASPWHRIEPGKSLTVEALRLINGHPMWRKRDQ